MEINISQVTMKDLDTDESALLFKVRIGSVNRYFESWTDVIAAMQTHFRIYQGTV